MALKWSNQLSSGIEAIDLQHKHILELLSELVQKQQASDKAEDQVPALIEFSKALQEHFDYEEALLSQHKFREIKRHKEGHAEIADLLDSMTSKAILDEKPISAQSLSNVVKWFEQHLMSEDVRFFKAIGKT